MGKLTRGEVILLSYAISNAILVVPKIVDLVNENNSFEYNIDENGTLEVTGQIKSSILSKCYLVERKDEEGHLGLSIINKDGIDILTDEFVTSVHEVEGCVISVDEDIYSVHKMSDYYGEEDGRLLSPDDVREILTIISKDFSWHEYKVLSYSY